MSNDLTQLQDWASSLLQKVEPAQRRELAKRIAQDLRRSNQQRIASQRNPDGSAYIPRKNLRGKQGRVKRKMFAKLRTAKYIKLRIQPDSAGIAFTGRVARIARAHQYGLRDRIGRAGPTIQNEQRALLGFTQVDTQHIRDQLIQHLTP